MLYFLQGWQVHILIRFTVRSFSDVDWKDWVKKKKKRIGFFEVALFLGNELLAEDCID